MRTSKDFLREVISWRKGARPSRTAGHFFERTSQRNTMITSRTLARTAYPRWTRDTLGPWEKKNVCFLALCIGMKYHVTSMRSSCHPLIQSVDIRYSLVTRRRLLSSLSGRSCSAWSPDIARPDTATGTTLPVILEQTKKSVETCSAKEFLSELPEFLSVWATGIPVRANDD